LIQDVNKWKKYVTEFKIEKVLKFLTTGFFGFYYHYRFYRILGVAAAAGAEVYAEAPGASSMRIFDQSYRKVSG